MECHEDDGDKCAWASSVSIIVSSHQHVTWLWWLGVTALEGAPLPWPVVIVLNMYWIYVVGVSEKQK